MLWKTLQVHPTIQYRRTTLAAGTNCFWYDFIKVSHRCGRLSARSSLQRCDSSLKFAAFVYSGSLKVPPQHVISGCDLDFDWTIATAWFFSRHSVVNLLLSTTHFQPSFSCQTDGITFDSTWCSRKFMVNSMTARFQGPNHHPSSTVLICCVWISPTMVLVLCIIA